MNKVKSAICFTLITILILGIVFMCTVSFSYGPANMQTFNSILSRMDKDAQLGNDLHDGQGNYLGGGYYAVFYPEYVISVKEYNDDRDEEGKKNYVPYPNAEEPKLYLETANKDNKFTGAADADGNVKDDFRENFSNALSQWERRIGDIGKTMENVRLDVRDDFSVQVYLPTVGLTGISATPTEPAAILNYLGHLGEFGVGYGSDADSATMLKPSERTGETINDYVKGARFGQGTASYVAIDFTAKGKDWLEQNTSTATNSAAVTLYFYVGGEDVVSVSVENPVTSSTVYISNSSFTAATARALAATLDTSLNGKETELSFSLGDVIHTEAQFGGQALNLLYIAFAVLFAGMMAFFFVRYKWLAFAHLYAFLIYLLPMILIVWGVPFLHLNVWTFLAVVLGGAILSVCDAVAFEAARKESAQGRNFATAVKNGYKKTFWGVFDLHIAVAVFGFLLYAIALTQLSGFGFVLGIAAVLSGLCSLAVTRFHWAMFATFAKDPEKMCNFKKGGHRNV